MVINKLTCCVSRDVIRQVSNAAKLILIYSFQYCKGVSTYCKFIYRRIKMRNYLQYLHSNQNPLELTHFFKLHLKLVSH